MLCTLAAPLAPGCWKSGEIELDATATPDDTATSTHRRGRLPGTSASSSSPDTTNASSEPRLWDANSSPPSTVAPPIASTEGSLLRVSCAIATSGQKPSNSRFAWPLA